MPGPLHSMRQHSSHSEDRSQDDPIDELEDDVEELEDNAEEPLEEVATGKRRANLKYFDMPVACLFCSTKGYHCQARMRPNGRMFACTQCGGRKMPCSESG
jgi:hypothetical protein